MSRVRKLKIPLTLVTTLIFTRGAFATSDPLNQPGAGAVGGLAGEAFANYVDNYNTGIDNSVFGTGATGTGQCPPGEEPVTYAYGTACVPSSTPPPIPPPACSTVRTCEDLQAENGGFIVGIDDGVMACGEEAEGGAIYTPAQISCIENGASSTREGCLELKCMRVDTPDTLEP